MPQLELTTFFTQYVWLFLSLVLVVIVTNNFIIPKIMKGIKVSESLSETTVSSSEGKEMNPELIKKLWES